MEPGELAGRAGGTNGAGAVDAVAALGELPRPSDVLARICGGGEVVMMTTRVAYELKAAGDDVQAIRRVLAAYGPAALSSGGGDGRPYAVVNGVAVIDVWGVLDRTDRDVTRQTWDGPVRIGTSYDSIRRSVRAAQADSAVSSVVVRFNSPGGDAQNVGNLASELADWADKADRGEAKRMVGFGDPTTASAALYLAAQLNEFLVSPGAWTGSIGTIMMVADYSRALDNFGIRVEAIKSVEEKDVGSPYRPITARDRELLQRDVNQYAGQFVAALASGRGVEESVVRGWAKERGFIGQEAVKVGMADGVAGSIEEVIARVSAKVGSGHSAGRPRSQAAGDPAEVDAMKNAQMLLDTAGTAPAGGGTGVAAGGGTTTASGGGGGGGGGGVGQAAIAEAQQQAVRAERERCDAIDARLAPYQGRTDATSRAVLELGAKAKSTGMSALDFSDAAMQVLGQAHKPSGHTPAAGARGVDVQVGAEQSEKFAASAEFTLLNRAAPVLLSKVRNGDDRADAIAEGLGYADAKAARASFSGHGRTLLGMSIATMMAKCIAMSQPDRYSFESALAMVGDPARFMAAAGHSTSDFPNLLSRVANKVLLANFMEIETVWDQVCGLDTSSDYKTKDLLSLSNGQDFQELGENDVPKEVSFNERKESIAVTARGIRFGLTYQMVRNDDLGGFGRINGLIGQSARRAPDQAFIALLEKNTGAGPTMSDGTAMFHANHKNLNLPGAAALGQASLEGAYTAFGQQVDFGPDGSKIEVTPRVLLVPWNLGLTAEKLVTNEVEVGTGATNAVRNVMRGKLKPVASRRLGSTTRWYLFADPNETPAFVMSFLDGVQTPEITPINDGDPMSIRMQATIRGFGCAAAQWEAAQSNAGV